MDLRKDRRVQYTKKILHEALFSLLNEKELREITITELCKAADVNRNTFYRHYNIPLDILLEIEDDVFDKLSAVLRTSTNMDEVILLSCQLLESDKQMSKIVFTKADGSGILSRILRSVRNNFPVENQIELTAEVKPFAEMAYQFGEKGSIAVIKNWIENDFSIPAESIAQIISYLVNKLNKL
ncbi:TetR/AcrR family transcriptional regulator [Flavobacterium sp. KACC 22758]|jgi:AcrR family transcriptional regulator|uniref:TetR/AcrR family transcriptional regulator n=1 Tax=Flavobacterium sp. KACC 22758 TaxID=3025667 RepID=UPI00236734EA|nr:TetR/AcrR family transcriptional regulator [Flavobacterium sp. KACC 22758]WDF61856.1 TetR/AcrR family transcriptional regulator [Flavobacterium sp. KACC 22758]